MLIAPNKVGLIPAHMGKGFCAYGQVSEEVKQWCLENGIVEQSSGKFTNLILPDGIFVQDLFVRPAPYKYLDGFSPNLNKHLHLGHLSNLVLAKAFQAMGVAEETVTIFGDTLTGSVTQEEALAAFHQYCNKYGYRIDHYLMASEMMLSGDGMALKAGEGEYEGTMVFDLGDQKVVGIKSGGGTTYFYQDMALAAHLNAPTLYLTGSEQVQHFRLLKSAFPHIDHIGLGLVLLNGEKMSSRNEDGTEKTEEEKREIYAKDVMEMLDGLFNDPLLSFNVLAGQILKSDPKSTKDINGKTIADPNSSIGLYISYTSARMKSAGVEPLKSEKFKDITLGYAYAKSMYAKEPHHLFNALFKHCMSMNALYRTHRISGNEENKRMFTDMMMDLELGLSTLGMFSIDRVDKNEG